MPKKLTREEKQAILKKTSDEIKAGTPSGIIAASILGKPYSVFNQCFLANQEAVPGIFGGFQQWRKVGRKVKKGEHGFSICFPMMRHQKEEQMTELMKEERPRFAMVSVFHFDQTEQMGDEYESDAERLVQMAENGETE